MSVSKAQNCYMSTEWDMYFCVFSIFSKTGFLDIVPLCCRPSLLSFCRAMLCKRGLCRYAVSVRPSVTFVHSVKINKHIFKFFFTVGSHSLPPNGGVECRWCRQKSRFWANILLYRVLSTLRPPGVINTASPDRGKLWHLSLLGSGEVCWWRETTTKCLWQEASTLRQRQQNSIYLQAVINL